MKSKLLYSLSIVLLSISTAIAQVPSNVPTTDLEAWWSFDGNTNDLSGNSNNFTNNGATLTTDRNGTTNSAYNYNGTNQYMIINSPSFFFGQSDAFSVSFWMYKTSLQYGIGIMQSSGVSGNFIWICQTNTSGNMSYGAGKQNTGWTWAASPYSTNVWEHYVATYDNGSMKIYKNGALVTSSTFAFTGSNKVLLPLRIGRSHNGNYFSGKVDDVGIWSRVITTAEISGLYIGCSVSVTNQPANVSTIAGTNVEFGIEGQGDSLTYQWQSASSGGLFTNLTNGGVYQDVTTDTLVVNGVTPALDGVNYRCVVASDSSCYDTSAIASMEVCGSINLQPTDQTAAVGTQVNFWAGSNDAAATYRWQINTATGFINLVDNVYYSGTTTDTLTIVNLNSGFDGKEFRCYIKSSVCNDTSSIATLTVGNIGVEEDLLNQGIVVYPNPVKNVLHLKVNESFKNTEFSIVNSLGQTVLKGELLSDETDVDVSEFAPGSYFLLFDNNVYQTFSILD